MSPWHTWVMWYRCLVLLCMLMPLMALDQRMAGSHVLSGRHHVVESDADPVDTQAALIHLDRFHDHLARVFDGIAAPPGGPEVVRYCRDRASFLTYGRAHCPGFSEGWYGYQLDATATSPAELVLMHLGNNRSVLQHEAFHRFMSRAYPGIRAWPRWFDEGLADWIARGRFVEERFTLPERLDPRDLTRVRDALSAGTFVPLERLMQLDNAGWNGDGQLLHYAESYLFTAWLMQVQEAPYRGLMRDFLLRLAKGQQYEPSLTATFGKVGLPRIEQAWSEWLRALR